MIFFARDYSRCCRMGSEKEASSLSWSLVSSGNRQCPAVVSGRLAAGVPEARAQGLPVSRALNWCHFSPSCRFLLWVWGLILEVHAQWLLVQYSTLFSNLVIFRTSEVVLVARRVVLPICHLGTECRGNNLTSEKECWFLLVGCITSKERLFHLESFCSTSSWPLTELRLQRLHMTKNTNFTVLFQKSH